MDDKEQLRQRIKELTGWAMVPQPNLIDDTTDSMRITRGDILCLDGKRFLITGHKYETRFGIGDQPKYWVLGAWQLDSGQQKILKTVFHEEFHVHIGVFRVHCYRSPEKEAQVLELVRGDHRFMQGYTTVDDAGNNVRVIDFIRGQSLFNLIYNINKSHRQYYFQDLPWILRKLLPCLEAIDHLHQHGTCHGDIRNDHIFMDADSGCFRWIDFDLNQNVADFDVWSIGNVINYAVAKGILSFRSVLENEDISAEVKNSLSRADGGAFYEYRIMNLQKIYPYVTNRLARILKHFTIQPTGYYESMAQVIEDYCEMLETEFPSA